MHRKILIASSVMLSLTLSNLAIAEIYKTVDKNGRVTYTDVPPVNTEAKPLELKSINSLPSPTAIPNTSLSNSGVSDDTNEYQVQITAPENGTTLMADERSVMIAISLNQNLNAGDLFVYKIDGDTLITTREMSYTIVEPPRGEHSLTVDVINPDGEILAQSNAITLLVMRPLPKQKAVPVPKK
ncbi:MAG TPA: DUF4124 domain-containing protein [Cellvibrio sp.]|nr:DUF4124 domain-containing protein [Cellvibrio sp.]